MQNCEAELRHNCRLTLWYFPEFEVRCMSSLSMKVNLAPTSLSDTVISFNASDIATLTAVCVVNLFFAGLVHRAVILSSRLLSRRQLFEGLSVGGFAIAFALCVFSVLTWLRNPVFVIVCTVSWSIFCMAVIARIWWGYHKKTARDELELPDTWHETAAENAKKAIPVARALTRAGDHGPAIPAQYGPAQYGIAADQVTISLVNGKNSTVTHRQPDEADTEPSVPMRHDKLRKYERKRRVKKHSLSNLAVYKNRS
jgi:hypothetical protein